MLTELFIAAGLWWRAPATRPCGSPSSSTSRSRSSASVQVFSFLAIAVLVIWAVPSTRDRVLRIDPRLGASGDWGALVRGLDWLARFRVEPAPPGSRLEVVDRDGTASAAAPAVALALSRLPLTAWFALPALLLPAVRRARRDVIAGRSRRAGMTEDAASRHARLAAGLSLALLLARRVRRARAARALPVGHAPASSGARRRPPSTGSSATSSRTAPGSTSTTPTTTRRRPSTTTSATPGR